MFCTWILLHPYNVGPLLSSHYSQRNICDHSCPISAYWYLTVPQMLPHSESILSIAMLWQKTQNKWTNAREEEWGPSFSVDIKIVMKVLEEKSQVNILCRLCSGRIKDARVTIWLGQIMRWCFVWTWAGGGKTRQSSGLHCGYYRRANIIQCYSETSLFW